MSVYDDNKNGKPKALGWLNLSIASINKGEEPDSENYLAKDENGNVITRKLGKFGFALSPDDEYSVKIFNQLKSDPSKIESLVRRLVVTFVESKEYTSPEGVSDDLD